MDRTDSATALDAVPQPYLDDGDVQLYHGDVIATLRSLPAGIAQTCITSPPYWGLRSYLPDEHDDKATELGLEATPDLYVERMVAVFREVWRVLRDDGTVWLNLGDSYNGTRSGRDWHPNWGEGHAGSAGDLGRGDVKDAPGLKSKDLVGIPWRVAFALQTDGWYLRSDIIWNKPNPMPESVVDRPTKAHEYLFLLTKQPRYFYDADAIREENQWKEGTGWARDRANAARFGKTYDYSLRRGSGSYESHRSAHRDVPGEWMPSQTERLEDRGADGGASGSAAGLGASARDEWPETAAQRPPEQGRNRRSVWTIPTEPFPEAHFATYPQALVRPCILAGTSEHGECSNCGAPWVRQTDRIGGDTEFHERPKRAEYGGASTSTLSLSGNGSREWADRGSRRETTGWSPSCSCQQGGTPGQVWDIGGGPKPTRPQLVLDPFIGSGTTALVARNHARRCIGIDLSAEYLAIAARRLQQLSLLGGTAGE